MTDKKQQPMIDLSSLINDRRDVTVALTVSGQPVDLPIAYNPGAFTDDFVNRSNVKPDADVIAEILAEEGHPEPEALAQTITDALKENQDREELLRSLVDILVELPINNNGEPLPITVDGLRALPIPVLVEIMQAVVSDVYPDAAANPTKTRWKKKARRKRKGGSFGGG